MKTHILKSWPVYFNEIWIGKKTFEIRENDLGFKIGDKVVLKEFLCDHEVCTGREIVAEITYLTHLLQKKGVVVFSIKKFLVMIQSTLNRCHGQFRQASNPKKLIEQYFCRLLFMSASEHPMFQSVQVFENEVLF